MAPVRKNREPQRTVFLQKTLLNSNLGDSFEVGREVEMLNDYIEDEIIVHPLKGMQLSEGYIRRDREEGYLGSLPGLALSIGRTKEEVRARLEVAAKAYYGEDIVVEIVHRALAT